MNHANPDKVRFVWSLLDGKSKQGTLATLRSLEEMTADSREDLSRLQTRGRAPRFHEVVKREGASMILLQTRTVIRVASQSRDSPRDLH